VHTDPDHGVGTLSDLLANDVVAQAVLVRENDLICLGLGLLLAPRLLMSMSLGCLGSFIFSMLILMEVLHLLLSSP